MWAVPSSTQTGEMDNRSEQAEGDLWPPPSLDLDLEYFLGEHMPQQGAEGRRDPQQGLWPKPFFEDHCKMDQVVAPIH